MQTNADSRVVIRENPLCSGIWQWALWRRIGGEGWQILHAEGGFKSRAAARAHFLAFRQSAIEATAGQHARMFANANGGGH